MSGWMEIASSQGPSLWAIAGRLVYGHAEFQRTPAGRSKARPDIVPSPLFPNVLLVAVSCAAPVITPPGGDSPRGRPARSGVRPSFQPALLELAQEMQRPPLSDPILHRPAGSEAAARRRREQVPPGFPNSDPGGFPVCLHSGSHGHRTPLSNSGDRRGSVTRVGNSRPDIVPRIASSRVETYGNDPLCGHAPHQLAIVGQHHER